MSHPFPTIQAIHRWLAIIAFVGVPHADGATPPTGLDKAFTVDEDVPHVFSLADYGFNDAGDVPPDSLVGIKFTLPALGSALTPFA